MPRDGRTGLRLSVVIIAALLPAPARSQAESPGPLAQPDARVVDHARQGAIRRLRSPECRKVLTDFRDGRGRPLDQRLAVFAVGPGEYLAQVAFLDGRRQPRCRDGGAEMVTTPGTGRVLVCRSFLRTVWRDRAAAEVYVIHEMLHTLGLGEDPPSQRQITEQVERRCAP